MGEAFEDLIFHGLRRLPRPGEELRAPQFARTMGGGTLITAVAATRMGARVEVVSALSDEAARRMRAGGASHTRYRWRSPRTVNVPSSRSTG